MLVPSPDPSVVLKVWDCALTPQSSACPARPHPYITTLPLQIVTRPYYRCPTCSSNVPYLWKASATPVSTDVRSRNACIRTLKRRHYIRLITSFNLALNALIILVPPILHPKQNCQKLALWPAACMIHANDRADRHQHRHLMSIGRTTSITAGGRIK